MAGVLALVRIVAVGSAGLLLQDRALSGVAIKNPWSALLCVVLLLCVAVSLLTWEPVRRRRYTLYLGSAEGGIKTLYLRPPELGGNRKLRRETQALVADIHAYAEEQTPPIVAALIHSDEYQKLSDAMGTAETEAEARRLWREHGRVEAERTERERQRLEQRFGGQLDYLFSEYSRRGMLTATEIEKLKWGGIKDNLVCAATKLDALARQL